VETDFVLYCVMIMIIMIMTMSFYKFSLPRKLLFVCFAKDGGDASVTYFSKFPPGLITGVIEYTLYINYSLNHRLLIKLGALIIY
jgi:hypothetical protein